MMFPIANQKVISKLTRRSLQMNKTRNRFVIIAIILTTLLITSVFSLGMSYVQSINARNLQIMGTLAHAALTFPSEEQVQVIKQRDDVKAIGLGASVAQIKNTPQMGNISVSMHWFDDTEWTTFRSPLLEQVVGRYPEQKNEMIAPTWILKAMGITNPRLGMEIPLTFYTSRNGAESDDITDTFILSGWYTESMNIRSGNIGSILVSNVLMQSLHVSSEKSGAASIQFENPKDIPASAERLEQVLPLTGSQQLKIVPFYVQDSKADLSTMAGFAGIIMFVILSGYLLIYNVLYISVSRDTRFYGLLKMIGTTAKQIRRIVIRQALFLACIGIPIGIVLGLLLSFIVVPMALSASNLSSSVRVSFSPLIYIGATVFALITTWISCIKPASIAGKVTPIEAIRYVEVHNNHRITRNSYSSKLSRMAQRNIFRDRKRAFIVFLSLFLGLTTFMTVNTLVLSMDTDNYIASYHENDFDLYNNTLTLGSTQEKRNSISNDLIHRIEQMKGITDVRKTYVDRVKIVYDAEVFSRHVERFYKRLQTGSPPNAQQLKDHFEAYVIGIDAKYVMALNQTVSTPVDIDRFQKGELALVGGNAEDFQLGEHIVLSNHQNKKWAIGGTVDPFFQAPGASIAPNIYISEEAFKQLFKEPIVYRLNIHADQDSQPAILEQIKQLIHGNPAVYMESALEQAEGLKSMKISLYILGGGISLILALIGILNFINTMYTGVRARRLEFAMMESIGMTRRQLKKMLLMEGAGYALISTMLIVSLGTAISYIAYRLFSQEATYAIYTFPALPLAISILLIFIVCLFVPLIAYRWTSQKSIVERIREAD